MKWVIDIVQILATVLYIVLGKAYNCDNYFVILVSPLALTLILVSMRASLFVNDDLGIVHCGRKYLVKQLSFLWVVGLGLGGYHLAHHIDYNTHICFMITDIVYTAVLSGLFLIHLKLRRNKIKTEGNKEAEDE